MPAEGSLCPTRDLTDERTTGIELRGSTALAALISIGSPSAVPVPCK